MPVRGVRGATVAQADTAEEIYSATRELLQEMLHANPDLRIEDLASVFFTMTEDLRAAYPAKAARELGWGQVPLLCSQEIPVPDGLPRCIRVLLHWNTDAHQSTIRHIYLGAATILRPDLDAAIST